MAICDEIILDRLTAREAQLHEQSNALDVKASIMLVAVTFLAGQTTYLISKHPSGVWRWEQFVSAVILFGAAVILAIMLRIQTYDGECAEDYLKWREEVIAHYGKDKDADITSHMRQTIVTGCKDRIEKARTINDGKAGKVKWIFHLTIAAFAFNLVAVIGPFL